MRNGAEYTCEFLKERVETVFGYPGANVLPLYDAIAAARSLRLVLTRHEQGAVHAAVGGAKATGRTGVVIATSGPGATNLVTGIADAYLDSAPLLVLTGQAASSLIGRDAFQEADILGITMPVTKHSFLVRRPDELATALREAWELAGSGRRGPVLVDIATDVLRAPVFDDSGVDGVPRKSTPLEFSLAANIKAAADAIASSKRPLILAGGGALDAAGQLAAYARGAGIPVVSTMNGLGIASQDCRYLGMVGTHGADAANEAMLACDCLIAVGCRFSDRTLPDTYIMQNKKLVHADIDPAELLKNVRPGDVAQCVTIAVDARDFADALIARNIHPLSRDRSALKREAAAARALPATDAERIADAVGRALEGGRACAVVTDVGNMQTAAAKFIKPHFPRGFITSGGLGAMGFGLPAAVGASYALEGSLPYGKILLLCGDGGFQMTLHELPSAKAAPLPIKIIISENASLGMVAALPHAESTAGAYALSGNPNFRMLAESYGIPCGEVRADDGESLDKAVSGLLASDGCAMLVVKTR